MSTNFNNVPIRKNSDRVTSAWWNSLRSAGAAVESLLTTLSSTVAAKADATALADHEADTTAIHGITDTALLLSKTADTGAVALPSGTTAQRPTGVAGHVRFNSDLSKFEGYNGSAWSEIAGSSGGSKNYITGGDGESGLIGTKYNNGAVAVPTTGSGGSPGIGWVLTSSSPHAGNYSFLLTPGSAGDGVAIPFTVDREGQARLQEISFTYEIGTYTAWTDGRVSVWVIAPSGAVIAPSTYQIVKASGVAQFKATFQTEPTGTSYKLCLHVNSSDSSWTSLKVDSIRVGPQSTVNASIISDWRTDWTPTGSLTTNVTYYGKWRQVGDSMEIEGTIAFSGANTQGVIAVTLPNSRSIDTTKISPTGVSRAVFGSARIYDASTDQSYDSTVHYDSSTAIRFSRGDSTAGGGADTSANRPFAFATGDTLTFHAMVPIVGWGSNVIASSDAGDGRVVALNVSGTSQAISTTTWTQITFGTTLHDSVGMVSGNTAVILSPGYYKIGAVIDGGPGTERYVGYTVNDATIANATTLRIASGNSNTCVGFSPPVWLNAGSVIRFGVYSVGAITLTTNSRVSVEKLQGPSAIAAAETCSARYTSTAGQSISNGSTAIIDFGTKDYDSHGAVTTGASWKFIAPISGLFDVEAATLFGSQSFTYPTACRFFLYKNGSLYATLDRKDIAATNTHAVFLGGSSPVRLLAGEYIDIRVNHDESTARTLATSAGYTYVSITRTGNY